MKATALCIVLLLLSGCATTYSVERTSEEGVTTKLTVKSYREFPGGIAVKYDRETGGFELQAGEVRNDEQLSALARALIPLIPVE